MKLTGSQRIAAPKQRVWEALNDPEVLKQCIPGCQTLEKEDGDKFRATVALKIGPMDARFAGSVTLTDLNPPNSYTITGQGQGGPAGFAKGSAKVSLADDAGATLLTYDVDAQVGGRLAQLGGPIIDATAKQLAGQFFRKFGDVVAPSAVGAKASPARAGSAPGVAAARDAGAPMSTTWVLSVIVALLAGLLFGGATQGHGGAGWASIAIGLVIIIAAAAGFEFGRRSAAPVVVLDAALLQKLLRERGE